MNLIHGLLALSLSALAAAGSPLPPAGSTPSSTDDLIEMARNRGDLKQDSSVHFYPDEIMVIDEDTDLAGTYVVSAFHISENVFVVATDDLTIIARDLVNVEGHLLGAHSTDGGVSIVLRSFGWLNVSGEVRSGDGVSTPGDFTSTGPDGGDLWISSPRGIAPGILWSGNGGSPDLVADGGRGGDAVMIGGIFGNESVSAPKLFAGHGGTGGNSGQAQTTGSVPIGGDGGAGGDGMIVQSTRSWYLRRMAIPHSLKANHFDSWAGTYAMLNTALPHSSMAFAMIQGDPELPNCFNGAGADGDKGEEGDFDTGTSPGKAEDPAGCCMEGDDGTEIGGTGYGGTGGHGGAGQAATGSEGFGGWGGEGGTGGEGIGGTGEGGGDATDCCLTEGSSCSAQYSKQGGNGAGGGEGIGGLGGGGGYFGTGSGDCVNGQVGKGGYGGQNSGGNGGGGGNCGASQKGIPNPSHEVRGNGGEGAGIDSETGGGMGGLGGWNGDPNATPGTGGYSHDSTFNDYLWDRQDAGNSTRGEDGEDGDRTGARCA